MLYTGKWNGIMIDVIYAGARGYIKKKRFSYPKPFSDICYTYDGLVSAVLSRHISMSGFLFLSKFINCVLMFFANSHLHYRRETPGIHC